MAIKLFPLFSDSDFPNNIIAKDIMDMYDFDSSDEREEVDNHSSSGGCKTTIETLSTDLDRTDNKKSKMIKKNYEPIKDGNIYVRYEDDPAEYKRLRKYLLIYLEKFKIGRALLESEDGRKELWKA